MNKGMAEDLRLIRRVVEFVGGVVLIALVAYAVGEFRDYQEQKRLDESMERVRQYLVEEEAEAAVVEADMAAVEAAGAGREAAVKEEALRDEYAGKMLAALNKMEARAAGILGAYFDSEDPFCVVVTASGGMLKKDFRERHIVGLVESWKMVRPEYYLRVVDVNGGMVGEYGRDGE